DSAQLGVRKKPQMHANTGGSARYQIARARVEQGVANVGAHLVTTTKRPEEIGSLSSPTGGEGWGEEAHSTGYPSPRSFLAGRGRRRFPVVVTRCAPNRATGTLRLH